MFQRRQRHAAALLAAVDALLVAGAFGAAYATRAALPMRDFGLQPAPASLILLAAAASVVVAGRWTGAHARLYALESASSIGTTALQLGAAFPPLLAFLYLLNLEVPVSRLFLGIFALYLGILQASQRALAARYRGRLRRALGAVSSVVVVGDGESALDIAAELDAAENHGLRVAAILDCGGQLGGRVQLSDEHRVRPVEVLPHLLGETAVDQVLFAVSGERLRSLEGAFALCDEHGVTTRIVADFFPLPHSRLHFDRFGDRPVLTFSVAPSDDLQLLVKRAFDLTAAAGSLMLLALPMAAVALAVKLTSPGPVLFRQLRCGLNARLFPCYKFRSMEVGAEARQQELAHLNEKDGPAFKIRDDPRLTPIGAFLRRYSIDEWPQFWNVLLGDMSLVGPRPAVPGEVRQYETWQRRRLRMRPGLTCLWAVRGRDQLDFQRWMELDLEYIDNWSLALDAKILALSVPVVLAGRGAN